MRPDGFVKKLEEKMKRDERLRKTPEGRKILEEEKRLSELRSKKFTRDRFILRLQVLGIPVIALVIIGLLVHLYFEPAGDHARSADTYPSQLPYK